MLVESDGGRHGAVVRTLLAESTHDRNYNSNTKDYDHLLLVIVIFIIGLILGTELRAP